MFAKEPHIKPLSNLKNTDRKKLLSTIKSQVNEDYTLPGTVVKQTSFQVANTAGSIYTVENDKPIWFKTKFEDMLYPTIYTLWQSQLQLIPIILTHDFVIEEHILGGAQLMLPGTVPPFPADVKKGTLVGIASTKQPLWVKAIGIAEMDLADITRVIGTKGIAVRVVHYFDDGLFKAFKLRLEETMFEEKVAKVDAADNEVDNNEEETDMPENDNEANEQSDDGLADQLDELSIEDVDHMLVRAVKYTIKFDDKVSLPMVASTFISSHVMKNLPDVDVEAVNLKKSSWKKATKFLKHLEDQDYLKLKGKNENCSVISVNKEHQDLVNMERYKTIADVTKRGLVQHADKGQDNNARLFTGENLYKPNTGTLPFLCQASPEPPLAYYTQAELKKLLDAYVTKNNLIDANDKSLVKFDDLLFRMSNKSTVNGGINKIARALLLSPTFLTKNFNVYHQIYKTDGTPLLKSPEKGPLPTVEIVTEKKIGRKVITRVTKFDKFNIDEEELAGTLRKRCSGSTTIGESKESKSKEVQVQGPHGALVISILNDYGIPTKWISFTNKVKPKQKRKP